jgi:hypothetical protein
MPFLLTQKQQNLAIAGFAIFLAAIILYKYIFNNSENFAGPRNIPYTEYHSILDCKYNGNCPILHNPSVVVMDNYGDIDANAGEFALESDVKVTNSGGAISFWNNSGHRHPDYNRGALGLVHPRGQSGDQPHVIGTVHSTNKDDNLVFHLYQFWDYKKNGYSYLYRDTKSYDQSYGSYASFDFLPVELSNGEKEAYDGSKVIIMGKEFVVTLYKLRNSGIYTRARNYPQRRMVPSHMPRQLLRERRYNPNYVDGEYWQLRQYAMLTPIRQLANDELRDDDRYAILFEQDVDRSRGKFNYYVRARNGVDIQIDRENKIYDGETIVIPGKEKFGEYKVQVIDVAF